MSKVAIISIKKYKMPPPGTATCNQSTKQYQKNKFQGTLETPAGASCIGYLRTAWIRKSQYCCLILQWRTKISRMLNKYFLDFISFLVYWIKIEPECERESRVLKLSNLYNQKTSFAKGKATFGIHLPSNPQSYDCLVTLFL